MSEAPPPKCTPQTNPHEHQTDVRMFVRVGLRGALSPHAVLPLSANCHTFLFFSDSLPLIYRLFLQNRALPYFKYSIRLFHPVGQFNSALYRVDV